MKKELLILTAAAGMVVLTATPVRAEEASYTIGICQFEQHNALEEASLGFKDALVEALGDQVTFYEQNAQGDHTTCTSIITDFVARDTDLILANSTAALQAAATATTEIPILGTSVTEYAAALQLDDFDGTVGRNISGVSDLAPLDEQAAMIHELFPEAQNVGLLYCSAEPNSQYQADVIQAELEALGYSCKAYTFSDSNDISSVTMTASSKCDVIYVPTDNTAAANAELIANICIPEGIPVITGEESTCRLCGAVTLSPNYYDIGYHTGEMAVRILADGEDITTMPIEFSEDFTNHYNEEICSELGIEVPDDYSPL
ncbi:ABC transporter substrate-binding protein [Ruminococcus sp. 5_1_39BFAA]|uniref:ABC transporter substrate-binding protein n=1 Tax=Ruminococcus sp. 5_1_39BFAA TaxID=457412 RepID=UPI00356781C9